MKQIFSNIYYNNNKNSKIMDHKTFLENSNTIHNYKFDYSEVVFINSRTKVKIKCPIHGVFEQIPYDHSRGSGCAKCLGYNRTTEDLKVDFRKIHGDTFDYSKVEFTKIKNKVIITCRIHGDFTQTPDNHLQGKGCAKCSKKGTSYPEQILYFYLNNLKLDVKSRIKINNKEIDIYIPHLKLGIEYDSLYYHKNRENKDIEKTNSLKNEGIELIRIREIGLNNIEGCYNISRNVNENINYMKIIIEKIIYFINEKFNKNYLIDINIERDKNIILSQIKELAVKNSIVTTHPQIIPQWHPTKNEPLNPNCFTKGSHHKIWWLCECGYEWKTAINHRTNGTGCPKCYGNIKSNTIEFSENANIVHNYFYNYSEVDYTGNTNTVKIICPIHGIFRQTPNKHLKGFGCAKCAALKRKNKL